MTFGRMLSGVGVLGALAAILPSRRFGRMLDRWEVRRLVHDRRKAIRNGVDGETIAAFDYRISEIMGDDGYRLDGNNGGPVDRPDRE